MKTIKALAVGVFAAVGTALWGVWFILACVFVGLILISASGQSTPPTR